MTQDLRDLRERASMSKHRCSRSVSQSMSTTTNASASKDTPHERDNRGCADGANRRAPGQKQSPHLGDRSTPLEIANDRVPDISRQRKPPRRPFAADLDLTLDPVDVVEAERGHFACAHPEPQHQQDDEMIAAAS